MCKYFKLILNSDLNGCDSLSACDAVVKIKCASASSDWKDCGETQEMKDDNFPVWPERFTFQYTASENLVKKNIIIDGISLI
jgi:hypothetical protein